MTNSLLWILLLFIWRCALVYGESSTCVMVYNEGGAPAVFQSHKCSRWRLDDERKRPRANCQVAISQGRRRHQEDRAFCALDMRVPFPGRREGKEIKVDLIAVFDGHNGAEASEMASKLLPEYFLLHVYFLLDDIYSILSKKSAEKLPYKEPERILEGFDDSNGEIERSNWVLSRIYDGSIYMDILKESLLRTIYDIDATFSKDAFRHNLDSGSTAAIVLKAEGHVLVANVGDSKALLCSECFDVSQEIEGTFSKAYRRRRRALSLMRGHGNLKLDANVSPRHLCVKELTEDHHPDRNDERMRIEAAGGFVEEWGGVPRVNGELAVSRAIGDVSLKKYGVISAPEVTDWQPLSNNDSYLVAATDGIFDKLTTQDICDLLWDFGMQSKMKEGTISTENIPLAECLVNSAFEQGSMDNLAAVVVPLESQDTSVDRMKARYDQVENAHVMSNKIEKLSYIGSAIDGTTSGLIPVEFMNRILADFTKILVKATHDTIRCFHLFENLNDNKDYMFGSLKENEHHTTYDSLYALPEVIEQQQSDWPLDLYNGHYLCLNLGMEFEGEKGQCINPEGFARVLGLIRSVPFNEININASESYVYGSSNFRYILKRRFDRGSYGEVWLAFHWNCSLGAGRFNFAQNTKPVDAKFSSCIPPLHNLYEYDLNMRKNSTCPNPSDSSLGDSFILKRIMVERGNSAYLSGLREKHFGEVFLNASAFLRGSSPTVLSNSSAEVAEVESNQSSSLNRSVRVDMGYPWNLTETFLGNMQVWGADYEEGLMHVARYIESFESQSKEIWLVFRNEGRSLSKLIYTAVEIENSTDNQSVHRENIQVLHPSSWWYWLRKTVAGKEQMRNIIWQLLLALKSCHDRTIIHRDIKPENMIICLEDDDTGRCLEGTPTGDHRYHLKLRIIDFGSAVDGFTIKHLYGTNGPSRSEQTVEYTPPEATLNASWFRAPTDIALRYDMWSVGVVMLELIIGSPHVFQISSRTRALLDQQLNGWNEETKELAYKLRSFMEMCILVPGTSPQNLQNSWKGHHDDAHPASWRCSEAAFSDQIKNRDPLKLGFPNIWALRLVRQLLLWHPEDRLSVDDALRHPYFQHHPG
ncbi:hypothetical protein AMTRI_Chr03g148290 [Amborella trichopoda]